MANTKIVLNRQSDLILDNALITNPQGIVLTDISGVSEAVASINTATSTEISTEASARVDGDQSLQNQIDFITNNTDPAAIDSLVEVVVAFQSADGDLNGAITNLANAATVDLSAEISNRTSADLSLRERFDEQNYLQGERITTEMSSELSSRVSADLSLRERFDEQNYLQGERITTEMSSELSSRISADLSLRERFDEQNYLQGERITTELSTELSSRVSADLSLRERFDEQNYLQGERITTEMSSELSSRVSADLSLRERFDEQNYLQGERITNELSTELSSRVDGDQSLQNQIDFITNNTDAAAIDSLTEIVSAFQSADGDINGAITALSSTATSGLSTEVAARESADVSIAADLSSELVARVSAIDNEASIRLAADESLATDLGFNSKGDGVEWNDYLDGFTNGLTLPTGGFITAEDFAIMYGPINSINFGAFRDRYISSLCFNGIDIETTRAESAEASLDAAKLNLAGGTMSGAIDMGGNIITNANTVNSSTIVTDAIDALSGPIAMYGQFDYQDYNGITNLGTPTANGDAANKLYVDSADQSLATALSSEESARIAADESLATDLGLGDLGGYSEYLEYIERLTNATGWDMSYYGGPNMTAQDFESNFGPANLTNYIAWRENRLAIINGWYNSTEVAARESADESLATALSSEISRAEAAEDSLEIALSSEVSYLIANTDLTSIDSFSEVVADLSTEVARAESAEASIDSFIGFDEKGSAANDTYSLYLDILAGNQQLVTPNGYVWSIEDISGEFGPANYTNYLNFARYYFYNLNSTALFEEVTRAESAELSLATDFTDIYFKKATFTGTIDNVNNQFTLASSVRGGSETVYLNGLLQEAGGDYTVAGDVISFDSAPKTGDKVVIYAVY